MAVMSSRVRYNLFMSQPILDALKHLSEKRDTTVSELIRVAVREYLTANGALPPQYQDQP
jgi:metal-responsive CopG/Arc/MetJ family transcriptional regulator